MNANTKHLLKLWGIAILFGGFTLFGFVAAIIRGDYGVVISVLAALVLIMAVRWWAKRKLLSLYQQPSADAAIDYYHKLAKKNQIPVTQAALAYGAALAAVLFGEFERARVEIADIPDDLPMYEGFKASVLSLIVLLKEKDYQRAALLARDARNLCEASANLPGAKTSRA